MRFLILSFSLLLTACASPPAFLANAYDRNDPCQARKELGRPDGYQRPSFCGASGNSLATVRDAQGRIIYDVRSR